MIGYLWLGQLIISALMAGIIWLIQLVHYPSFRYIDVSRSAEFHSHHTSSIGPIVAPLMILEMALSAYLAYREGGMAWLVLVLVIVIWISTFGVQVPLHNSLGRVWDLHAIDRLVQTNWIRTIAWTAKLGVVVYLISGR